MRKLRANTYELGHPQGWADQSTVTMIAPPTGAFAANVQVNQEPLPAGRTVEQYVAEQRTELSSLDGFRLLEQGDRLLGGQRAEHHVYEWKVPQGWVIRQMQLSTSRGSTLYTLTCSAMESEWAQFEAAFDMVVLGFRFID